MASIFPQNGLEAIRLKEPERLIQTQVRIRIPKNCHADPVISSLINRYDLKVNILAALLGTSGKEDGWFDLKIDGKAAILHKALLDLVELDADLWFNADTHELKQFVMAYTSLDYGLESIRLKEPNSLIETRVKIRIPKTRHLDPVISNLIRCYDLKINIVGALLDQNSQEDGWFDLVLNGRAATIHEALLALIEIETDLWFDAKGEDVF